MSNLHDWLNDDNPRIPEHPKGSGSFGRWITDASGLPAYEYELDERSDARAKYQTTRGASRDHWHLLGNDRVIATAHNGGYVQLYDWGRGGKVLNRWEPERMGYSGGFKFISMNGRTFSTLRGGLPKDATQRRVFGTGYFLKETRHDEMTLIERIEAPDGDDPVLISKTEIRNESNADAEIGLVEFWAVNPEQLLFTPFIVRPFLMLRKALNRLFRVSAFHDEATGATGISVNFSWPSLAPHPETPFLFDCHPKTVFLAPLDDGTSGAAQFATDGRAFFGSGGLADPPGVTGAADGSLIKNRPAHRGDSILEFRRTVRLAPGETARFRYIYGYSDRAGIRALVEKHSIPKERKRIPHAGFRSEGAEWLERECAWHSYYLQAGTLYSDFYRAHFVDQASAYSFEQGLSGASRDFALFILALTYLRPSLAREMLRFMMATQNPETGALPYAHMGHGVSSGVLIHSWSSDQDLFFMWALAEYLSATRDMGFLEEDVPFNPPSKGRTGKVFEHVQLSFRHLTNRVGVGAHGMIRSGTGDWNDGLLPLSGHPFIGFLRGESAQNAALAALVLPAMARHLGNIAAGTAALMREFAAKQTDALKPMWTGEWMARGYTGRGDEMFGRDRLFLDAQPFAVLGGALNEEQSRRLFANVEERCVRPEATGALMIWPADGSVADPGSTWAAVDSLTAWAWGHVDRESAWRFFLSTTLAARAEAYPDLWYGIWSGPDAYYSSGRPNAGQAFNSVFTPAINFPVMNMNRHAGPLHSLIKLSGVRPRDGMIVIDPLVPLESFALRLPLLGFAYSPDRHDGYYRPVASGRFEFAIRLPKGAKAEGFKVILNGEPAQFTIDADGLARFSTDGEPGSEIRWEIAWRAV
ncbi:MAG TPA: hypothetical protein PL033_14060 [Candidatus Brocadiia bacterium]|nr:hypothetical protein [Candidatus Brocadiia bacterium]